MAALLKLDTIADSRRPEDTIAEAFLASRRIGLWVEIEINGVRLLISPGDTLDALRGNWRKAFERGADFASANVVPAGRAALEQGNG